jgi:succinate dehydrogenase flavin-adding protein (antitoxin of CptAB toxin-antitoxin module)
MNKPAWHDEAVDRLQVRLEDTSRLRKLKKEEAEQHITGQQYAERLQHFYSAQLLDNQDNDIFSWANPKTTTTATV